MKTGKLGNGNLRKRMNQSISSNSLDPRSLFFRNTMSNEGIP